MHHWFRKVSSNPDDLSSLVDAILYFEQELQDAKYEVKLSGSVAKAAADLPGIVEHRFGQYQEVEAILKFVEILHTKKKGAVFKGYLEHYNKALSAREAEKYADADPKVIELNHLINEIALVRNAYMGIMKGLDAKQWQIGNLTKLRVSGMEDFSV